MGGERRAFSSQPWGERSRGGMDDGGSGYGIADSNHSSRSSASADCNL